MAIGNRLQETILKQMVSSTERTPCLRDDTVRRIERPLLNLRKIRMKLYLVDGRGDAGFTDDRVQMFRQEIAHADGPDHTAPACLDQRAPSLDVKALLGVGPVDEVQVVIIQLRAKKRFLDGRDGLVEMVMPSRKFRCDAQVRPGPCCTPDAFPKRTLIFIIERGIEKAVAVPIARAITSAPIVPFSRNVPKPIAGRSKPSFIRMFGTAKPVI
jgi:hypothetical protein